MTSVPTTIRPRVLIIHGTGGNPCSNWFPWLADQLSARDFEVLVPWLPTPEGQDLKSWLSMFKEDAGALRESDILIGHSVGATFALRLLELSQQTIRACFLVSGFTRRLNSPEFDPLISSFVYDNFKWSDLKSKSQSFSVYHGSDDPYVPCAYAEELASHLGVSVRLIEGGGHLNAESGYSEFEQLLEDILKVQ